MVILFLINPLIDWLLKMANRYTSTTRIVINKITVVKI